MEITLPYNYSPRDYQIPAMEALDNGTNRIVTVWHRRSGKDKTFINLIAKKMFERVGSYFYIFPTYAQGKKILWNGMDKTGFKHTDHIPKALRKRTDNSEMLIETVNGSILQVIGSDNVDSIVGTNPVGCVFSEYSLQDPNAWNLLRPILAENGGFAIFNYTPRGENHGYRLLKMAQNSPHWFAQVLTVDDTNAISKDVLEQERAEIMAENGGDDALFWQEYYCDFKVPIQGSYYGKLMQQADQDGRIGQVPYEPALPVHTFWDLGIGDSMVIWFVQLIGKEYRIIDYYENNNEGLAHYIKVLRDKPYIYGRHYAPHDIEVRELSTGKSRKETASSLGIDFEVMPKLPIDDGIDAVRNILPRCWFDAQKCERGIDALKSYHKEYDEKNKIYRDYPKHDWSSHAADAFRGFAVVGIEQNSYYVIDPAIVNSGGIKPYYEGMLG